MLLNNFFHQATDLLRLTLLIGAEYNKIKVIHKADFSFYGKLIDLCLSSQIQKSRGV